MKISEDHFRALLAQAIDENPLCCRAVLSLCKVEFTNAVQTLAVSLGKRSVLQVNLDFVREHCETEDHVHALLLHEFLHILLGHTVNIQRMTPALNIALDAVINAIIHRTCGASHSSLMASYYAGAKGPLRLLRPMTDPELHRLCQRRGDGPTEVDQRRDLEHLNFHHAVTQGFVTSSDILDYVRHFDDTRLEEILREGPVLLGGHGQWGDPLDALPSGVRDHVRHALAAINGRQIWGGRNPLAKEFSPQRVSATAVPPSWSLPTRKLLLRLLVPDPMARPRTSKPIVSHLPILNASDRRGAIRSLWNPLLPEMNWPSEHPTKEGTVQIYLDVSGSMNGCLQWLVALLAEFSAWIRHPLWALSSEVAPATIRHGRLVTRTTGATVLQCALAHARKSGARKALIITDGFVETPPEAFHLPCPTEAFIPHDGASDILASYGIPVTKLPPTADR